MTILIVELKVRSKNANTNNNNNNVVERINGITAITIIKNY